MRCESGNVLTPYGPPETIQALAATPVPPTTGDSWTATGSVAALPASIYRHSQSTLPDGRVVVSGNGVTYIYTPSSNMWEVAATVPANFYHHGQSALNDGRIFVSGGFNGSTSRSVTYIYNSDSDIWASVSPMPTSFYAHGQSALLDDRVLVSGGYNGTTVRNTVYTYNTSINMWTSMVSMTATVCLNGQSSLLNGNVFIAGGGTSGGAGLRTTSYIYTPIGTGSWSNAANFTIARDFHGQSTLLDGRVLINAGRTGASSTTNTSHIYNSDTNTWTTASSVPDSFMGHGQSTLTDGRVLISGGNNSSTSFSTAYIYTPTGWED